MITVMGSKNFKVMRTMLGWMERLAARAGRRSVGLALGLAALLGLAVLEAPAQLLFQPSNDYFTNAWMLLGDAGATNGDSFDATLEANEPTPLGITTGANSVWFRWSPTNYNLYLTNFGQVYATFDTLGSSFDTVLAVYEYFDPTGSTNPPTRLIPNDLYLIGANDDYNAPGAPATNTTSQLTFAAYPGITYYISVSGYTDLEEGLYQLNWNYSANFSNAVPSFNEIDFAQASYTVAENAPGFATINVTYHYPFNLDPVTVDYATLSGGSARPGVDYLNTYGTLTFLPGQSNLSFTIPIIDNALANSNKTILLGLKNISSNAVLGSLRFATLTIIDNETVPPPAVAGVFNFSARSYRMTEYEGDVEGYGNAGGASFDNTRCINGALITVTRSAPAVGRVLVDFYTTNKFNSTNLLGLNYGFIQSVGLSPYYNYYGGSLADFQTYFAQLGGWAPAPVIGVPGSDYLPTNGTLVFDDFQMSAEFVVPNYFVSAFGTNTLRLIDLVLTNPRPAPEEDATRIVPTLGATNEAVLGVVDVSAYDVTSNLSNHVYGFSLLSAHYRLNEFGRREQGNTNVNRLRVSVMLPGGAGGSVGVHVDRGYTFTASGFLSPGWFPDSPGHPYYGYYGTGTELNAGSDYADSFAQVYPNTIATDGSDPILNVADFTPFDISVTVPKNFDTTEFTITITNDTMVEFNEDFMIWLYPLDNNPPLGPNSFATVTILYDDQPAGAADREWNPENISYSNPPFNQKPGANSIVYAAAIQADQRALLGGDFTAYNGTPVNRIVRLLDNGFLDTSFHSGVGADSPVHSIALYSGADTNGNPNKILIGGAFTSYNGQQRNGVARLNSDGSLDNTFRPGFGANGPVYSVALQQDGKVVVGGDFTQFNGQNLNRLARLNNDGTVDLAFNPGYGADAPIYGVAVRDFATNIFAARVGTSNQLQDTYVIETGANQGQITLNYDFPILNNLRVYYDLNPTPLLDVTLLGAGVQTLSYGPGISTQIKIVMNEGLSGLDSRWRYTATIVPIFTNRTIFVAGDFVTFDNQFCGGVARLLDNGSLDQSYSPGAGADRTVWSLAVQPDGKALLGGAFAQFDFHQRNGVVRLNLDGSVDESFNPGAGFDGPVFALALQADMKPVLGGLFTQFNSTRRMGVARLMSSGALDTGFLDTAFNQFAGLCRNFSFESPGFVSAVALQADGDVLIGGFFTNKLGGNSAFEVNNVWLPFPYWTRADKTGRQNVARLIGNWGFTPTQAGGAALVANSPQGPGNLEFLQDQYSVDEGALTLSVTMRRLDGRLGTVAAMIDSTNSTALAGLNYQAVATNVLWPEDFNTTNWIARNVGVPAPRQVGYNGYSYLTIPIVDDNLIQGDHTFDLGLFQAQGSLLLGGETIPVGAALGDTMARVTIVDNDFPHGTLTFSSPSYAVGKHAGSALITLVRTNGTKGLVTVDYYTADNSILTTASADTAGGQPDYTSTRGTLSLPDGVTSASFRISIWNNTQVSFDKTVLLVLTNATGGAILPGGLPTSSTTALLTIIDDNYQPGHLNFAVTNYFTNENAGLAWIAVTRSGGSLGEERVTASTIPSSGPGLAQAGINYSNVSTVLIWSNFDIAPKFLVIPLLDDGKVTGPLTNRLALSNPLVNGVSAPAALGNRSNAVLTVTDDDSYGTLSFSLPLFYADENGGAATVTVVRQGATVGTVTVDYATQDGDALAGSDYTNVTGTLVFGSNDLSKSVAVGIMDNSIMDGNRDFSIQLANPYVVTNQALLQAHASDPAWLLAHKSYGQLFPAYAGGLGQPNPATVRIVDDESSAMPAGSLDTSFNENNTVGADLPVYVLAYQTNDNRILMAGDFRRVNGVRRTSIARLNPDASLDGSFNAGEGPNGAIRAMAVQNDGHILVGGMFTTVNGTNRNHIARLNPDGTLDGFFNPGSGTDSSVAALSLRADGRILMAGAFTIFNGQAQPYIVLLNTNGTVQPTFSVGVGPNGPIQALAQQSDGKILIGGDFTMVNNQPGYARLARLNADGSLDTSFVAGTGPNNTVRTIVVQADGRILIGGSFTNYNNQPVAYLARLLTGGALDTTYMAGVANPGANDVVYALAVQADGKLVAGGGFTRFNGVTRNAITRLNSDGTTDFSINFGSGADGFVAALALQPDRKILLGGGFTSVQGRPRLHVARVHGGSLVGSGAFQFSAAEYDVNTGDGFGVVTVQRTGGTFGTNGVRAATSDGTAVAGQDYLTVTTNLVFPPGEVLESFLVTLTNGHFFGDPRYLNLLLASNSVNSALGLQPNAILKLFSQDCRVGFQTLSYSIARDVQSGFVPITLVRTDASNSTVTLSFAITPGPGSNNLAQPGVDYVDVSTNFIQFKPGEMSKVILVPIIATNGGNGNRTALLTLSNIAPTNFASLAISNATLTIVDNVAAPGVLGFASTNSMVSEDAGVAALTVVRTGGSSGAVSVSYRTTDGTALAGRDYVPVSGNLGFSDGETTKIIYVTVLDNHLLDPDHFLQLLLSRPTGGATLGLTNTTLTIQEYLAGTNYFIFAATNFGSMESDPVSIITILRTNNSRGEASVDCATSDGLTWGSTNYYIPRTGPVYFTNGQTVATFLITNVPDQLGNPDRTVNLTLSNPHLKDLIGVGVVISQSNAVLTITNDDATLKFSTANTLVSEAAGNARITVIRSGTTNGAISVDYRTVAGGTAVDGLDYLSVQGRLSFSPGQTTNSFTVPIIDNNVVNLDKTVFLILTNPLGISTYLEAPTSATLTIHDDESNPPVAGNVDPTFNYMLGANDTVEAVLFDASQELYVGGSFTNLHGLPINRLGRLNIDGTADLAFNPGRGADATVYALAFSSNVVTVILNTNLSTNTVLTNIITPAIVIGGAFTNVDGQSHPGLARLGLDGTVEPTFNVAGGANGAVRAVAVQSNGQILIGGEFTSYETNRSHVARLNLNGTLDPTFVPPTVINGIVYALQPLAGGQVLIGGAFTTLDGVPRPSLARLNADGSLDSSFGPAYGIDGVVRAIALQPDGRIMIGGDFVTVDGAPRMRVARLQTDGSVDVTFDPEGGAEALVQALQVQANGQILAAGRFTTLNGNACGHLGRFNPDGSVDTYFNPGTGADAPVHALALAPLFTSMNFSRNSSGGTNEDRVVVDTGWTNGILTLNFSTFVTPSFIRVYYEGVVIYDSGLVLGPQFPARIPYGANPALNILGLSTAVTVVVNQGGGEQGAFWTYAASFVSGTPGGSAPDNLIAVGGEFVNLNGVPRNRVAELQTSGDFVAAFDPGASANLAVAGLGVYSNPGLPGVVGDIVAGGDFTALVGVSPVPYVGRLRPDGSFDRSFNVGSGPNGPVRAVAVQPDGKVVVGGLFTSVAGAPRAYLARLNVDGTLDTNFNRGIGFNGGINALVLQPDGKVLVAGDFTSAYGVARAGVARVLTNGTVDAAFVPGAGAIGSARALALQPDGKVLLGGDFTNFNNLRCDHLVRLTTNGAVDATFTLTNGTDAGIETISLDALGRVLIGGRFTLAAAGTVSTRLARLLANGLVDPSLNWGGSTGGADDTVKATLVDPAGQLLVGGAFTALDGLARNRLARLNGSNGALDPTINFGTGANNFVNAVRLQDSDGKMVVAGGFTQFSGQVRWGVARLFGGTNADAGQFQLAASAYSVSEDGTNAIITVVRAKGATGAATVHFQTVENTAKAGVDFTPVSTDLAFGNAEVTKTVSVPVRNNQTNNPGAPLQFNVVLSAPTGLATLGAPVLASVSILDNDIVMAFSSATFSVSETDGAARISVVRQGGLDRTAFVDYATTTNGTALAGVDYLPVTATLVFNPGVSVRSFTVPVINDNIPEFDETVGLVLSKPASDTPGQVLLGANRTAVLTIVDRNSSPGLLTLSTNNYVVSETNGPVAVTVLRTNGHSGTVWVHFTTLNGSALAPSDYLGTNGVLVFEDGEVARTILIPVVPNPIYRGDRSFFFQLSGAGGGAGLLQPTNATVTILEDQPTPSFVHMAVTDQTVAESVGLASVLVVRSNNLAATIQVDFLTIDGSAVAGVDYVGTNGTLTLNSGDAGKAINIRLINDGQVHSNRAFGVVLTNARPAAAAVLISPVETIVTILNDSTTVGYTTNNYAALKSDFFALIPVARLGQTNTVVSVDYSALPGTAVSNFDFVPVSGTLTFAAGVTQQFFFVRVLDNYLQAPPVTVLLSLSNIVGAAAFSLSNAVLTITDYKQLPGMLVFDQSEYVVSERGANAVLTVLRTNGWTGTVSVQYQTTGGTATPGVNYDAQSGVLVFADGQTDRTITIPVHDNHLAQGNATFNVILSSPLGGAILAGNPSAEVTITEVDFGTGSLDLSFDPGTAANAPVSAVALAPDGTVLAGGSFTSFAEVPHNHLVRLQANGAVDPYFLAPLVFTNSGYAWSTTYDPYSGLPITTSNYVVFTNVLLAGPDATVSALSFQNNGALVLGGVFVNYAVFTNYAVLTNYAGRTNVGIYTNYVMSTNYGLVTGYGPLTNYNVVNGTAPVGAPCNRVGRVLANSYSGALDPSFTTTNTLNAEVRGLAPLVNNKLYLAGAFSKPKNDLVRFLANGATDSVFDTGTGLNGTAFSVGAFTNHQANVSPLLSNLYDRVVVGGNFTLANGLTRSHVARFFNYGSVDDQFVPPTISTGAVYAVALVQDFSTNAGKVMIGGDFTNVNGQVQGHLTRLTDSGALDASFNPGGAGADGVVYALALLPNGKMLIGGDFTHYNGLPSPRLARLNPDGSMDASFNVGLGADNTVYSIAVQPDGNVVIGGRFNQVFGFPRNGVARLLGDPARPRLLVSRAGNLQISFIMPGRTYVLESSSDMRTWTGLSTNVAVWGLNTLSEAISLPPGNRFYRVRVVTP